MNDPGEQWLRPQAAPALARKRPGRPLDRDRPGRVRAGASISRSLEQTVQAQRNVEVVEEHVQEDLHRRVLQDEEVIWLD
jgi:hypothetical protein